MDQKEKMLTESEAAEMLRISARALATLRGKGEGPPYVQVGGGTKRPVVRYAPSAIREWTARGNVGE